MKTVNHNPFALARGEIPHAPLRDDPRFNADADFLAAEQQIAELRAARDAVSAIITREDEERLDKPLADRMWALYDMIALSPPVSLMSARASTISRRLQQVLEFG
jgi:hypothetical protein